MTQKYMYWAPQIFGKDHACALFELNGRTSLRYFGEKSPGDKGVFAWGEVMNVGFDDYLYNRTLVLNVGFDETKTEIMSNEFFVQPCAMIPAYWAGNYIFDSQEHVLNKRKEWYEWNQDTNPDAFNWDEVDIPEPTKIPEYIDKDIPVMENIQRILDIADPDLVCSTVSMRDESIDIDLKKYKHVIPYKSQGYKYLLLDLLGSTNPKDLQYFSDVEELFKEQLHKFKTYIRCLEDNECEWEWLDISDDEDYKEKFNIEKTLDFISNDPRWFDPIVQTSMTMKCSDLVDKYFDRYYNVLNDFFPKVLS